MDLFSSKAESKGKRKEERKRRKVRRRKSRRRKGRRPSQTKIFHLSVHFPNGHSGQGWDRPKQSRFSSRSLTWEAGDQTCGTCFPSTLAVSCFLKHLSDRLDHKWNSWHLHHPSYVRAVLQHGRPAEPKQKHPLLKLFVDFKRQKHRHRDYPPSGSLPKCLQQPELVQAKPGNRELI